ncbi:MAG: hypothetical protein WC935_08690, partial [Thermoleophilia bacterium]
MLSKPIIPLIVTFTSLLSGNANAVEHPSLWKISITANKVVYVPGERGKANVEIISRGEHRAPLILKSHLEYGLDL